MENPRAEKVKQPISKGSPKTNKKAAVSSEPAEKPGKETVETAPNEQEFFVTDEKTGSKWKKVQPRLVLR
jgi:hypothetical protein